MAAVASEIRHFIVDNYLFGQEEALPGIDESLMQAAVIDSTGVLELVLFLEEKFDIQVDDAELLPDNLDSVSRLVAFVERKQGTNGV